MEVWDAYNKEFEKIEGMTLIRGEAIPDGVYHLVSDVIVKHADGYYLLMQRDSRGIAFYTAFDISRSPAKVFGDSGMHGCDFCGSSGRALYQDRFGHKMTGY